MPALLFAVVQGVTEFLPVSSSGHLVLLALILGGDGEPLFVVSALHVATALAAVIYYRRAYRQAVWGLWQPGPRRRFALRYLAAQASTAAIALPLVWALTQTPAEQWRLSAGLLGGMMLLNAVILLTAPRGAAAASGETLPHDTLPHDTLPQLTWRSAAWVGLAQGAATLPGLSRSGLTVAAGRHAGLSRGEAASLSFLLAPPVILATAVFWSAQVWPEPLALFASWQAAGPMLGMAVITFFIALAALHWVVSWVRAGRLWWFAPWSAVLGIATLATAAF